MSRSPDAGGGVDLTGRVCVVTGASSGIGKVTARALAAAGARVVLVVRDEARGRAAIDEIVAAVPQAPDVRERLELALCDLSRLDDIRRVGAELVARHPRIHVLVNNAGAIHQTRKLTADGLEMTFAVNHLAYFLLTKILLSTLKASAPARIVNVSSGAHTIGRIRFDDLQSERGYVPMRAYAQSKLANVMFTYELARRLEGSGVTANCLHPGAVASGFGQNDEGLFNLAFRLVKPLLLSEERGARTSIYLATSPEVATTTGQYFARCKPKRSSKASYDVEAQRRLWDVSEELVGRA
jgi:NAD(P)-dependent dehydrogenase (short-subunit alcohol dehydrogenase family)